MSAAVDSRVSASTVVMSAINVTGNSSSSTTR